MFERHQNLFMPPGRLKCWLMIIAKVNITDIGLLIAIFQYKQSVGNFESFSLRPSNREVQVQTHSPKMILTLFLVAVIVSLLYLYFVWNNNYFKNLGVPHIPPSFFTGNAPNGLTQKRNAYYDVQDVYK